jgi:hypothetical protein
VARPAQLAPAAPAQPAPPPTAVTAPAVPPPAPADLPYAVNPPLFQPEAAPIIPPEPVSPEDRPRRRRPAPLWPLLEGVYTFPWYPSTMRVWILVGLGLAVLSFLAAANYWLILELADTGIIGQYLLLGATIGLVKGMIVFGIWTIPYMASYFLGVVQETAYGNDEMQWPDDTLFQRLVKTGYVIFLGLCAAFPLVFLAVPLLPLLRAGAFGWLALFIPWAILFPIVLLSALANDSPWLVWNNQVVGLLVRRPAVLGVLAAASVALVLPCFTLGYFTVLRLHFFLAPLTGFMWSAALLLYARLLGRVAWLAVEDNRPARVAPRKRKKRRKAVEEPLDWGA